MKTLLERAFNHLINGDEDKAAALFHKFMVERARQIHEALRESDGAVDDLDDNWDSEIKEEEYFGDDDLDDGDAAPEASADDGMGDDMGAPTDDMGGDDVPADTDGDDVDQPDDFGGDAQPDDLEGKIDDLTDKIDELTAEFDRVMSEFHDDDDGDDMGDDFAGDDTGDDFADDTTDDVSDSMDPDTTDDNDDLAGRMEDDMSDDDMSEDDDAMAEGKMPDFLKKDKDDLDEEEDSDPSDSMSDDDMGDDDLADITESVLAELDKIAPPANTEHKGVGANTAKNNITSDGNKSALTHHNVMDRVNQAKPVMTKGPTHKGYARETPPTTEDPNKLVKDVRPGNRRKSYKDTMGHVEPKGDAAAALNKDYAAGGPKPTRSTVDGKTTKG